MRPQDEFDFFLLERDYGKPYYIVGVDSNRHVRLMELALNGVRRMYWEYLTPERVLDECPDLVELGKYTEDRYLSTLRHTLRLAGHKHGKELKEKLSARRAEYRLALEQLVLSS